MLSILLVGRAGASPPSRTAAIIFLYIYLLGERERAHLVVQLRLFFYIFIYIRVVRTSCPKSSMCFFFSDISIFLRRKCYTRFFFSDISIFPNLYAMHGAGAMRHGFVSHGSLVHSHRDFRVRRSVVRRALNWLVTHNQYYRSNHVHIDVNALEQLPHDGNLS